MDDGMRLCRMEGVVFEEVAGEAVLIQVESGAYFALNRVGTEFWGMLDGEATVGELVGRVAERYGVGVERVGEDFGVLVEQWLVRGLVRVVSGE